MFDFGSILASVFASVQELLTNSVVEWFASLLGGFLPIA